MSSLYDLEFGCAQNPRIISHAVEWLQAYEARTGEPVWSDFFYLWNNAARIWIFFLNDEYSPWTKFVPHIPLWDSMEEVGWAPCELVQWPPPSPPATIEDLKKACAANQNLVVQAMGWLTDYEAVSREPVWTNTSYLLYWSDRLWLHFRQAQVAIFAPDPGPLPLWNAMEAVRWVKCEDVGKPPPTRYYCASGKCVASVMGGYPTLAQCQADCKAAAGGGEWMWVALGLVVLSGGIAIAVSRPKSLA